ncbi:MAG TPA: hypothetical protein PKD69_08700, partial [Elusimicrobiota bacterium]|nr:hypothetical protein [Elusimicrobiota bacterium]
MKHRSPPVVLKSAPDSLPTMLAYLNLPVSAESYADLLAKAGKDNLSHEIFLKRLLSNEVSAKF